MTTEEISASCGSDIPEDLAIKDDIPIESPQNQRDSDDLSMDPSDIIKALEVVERDSVAIAENFASLFSSLRSSLSEVFRSFDYTLNYFKKITSLFLFFSSSNVAMKYQPFRF